MNYKAIFIPALLTGIIAGASEFLVKYQLGWKTALVSASMVVLIQVCRQLLEKYPKTTAMGRKRTKLFVGE